MRIIHGKSYTLDERKKYIHLIIQNIVESVVRLVEAMISQFYSEFQNEINNAYFTEFILNLHQTLKSEKLTNTDW
jgi:hypothetical protein